VREAGLKQCIVSSTPRANIELVLDSLGVKALLDAIVGEEDVSRGKPDPQGFLLGAERLGVPPPECVVFEDAPEGIAAGKAAGMRCIGVATTRPPERLGEADLVVPSLEDARVATYVFG
jgi:beta-phosphoglucomutase-like phosphatase (HAD superfamily)